jgi:hypothetical protein
MYNTYKAKRERIRMVVESIREFQKDLTKHLKTNEPVMIRDKKTQTPRGVFLPMTIYNEMLQDYKQAILDDAVRTFSENPATDVGIEAVNKGLK